MTRNGTNSMAAEEGKKTTSIRNRLLKNESRSADARDALLSQRAIMEAATLEFSSSGLEGARVDRIALAAGINKQLLYRYFGNKEDLYMRVLEDAYFQFREADLSLGLEQLEPVEALRKYIASSVERTLTHPQFSRLIFDENFHKGRHVRSSEKIKKLHHESLAAVDRVLRRGEESGVFRRGVNTLQLFLSIGSLGAFYVTNMHTVSAIFNEQFEQVRAPDLVAAYVEQMLLRFVLMDPAGYYGECSRDQDRIASTL